MEKECKPYLTRGIAVMLRIFTAFDNHRADTRLKKSVPVLLAKFAGFLVATAHVAITEHATTHQTKTWMAI